MPPYVTIYIYYQTHNCFVCIVCFTNCFTSVSFVSFVFRLFHGIFILHIIDSDLATIYAVAKFMLVAVRRAAGKGNRTRRASHAKHLRTRLDAIRLQLDAPIAQSIAASGSAQSSRSINRTKQALKRLLRLRNDRIRQCH